MIHQLYENKSLWYNIFEGNIMPMTEKTCVTCEKRFFTNRSGHKGRNPTFCSNSCRKPLIPSDDPRFKWRKGKGFWQTSSQEEKFEKLKQLYEKNVIKNDYGCWGWKNKLMDTGYAKLGMGRSKIITAHRFSWTMHNGKIDIGLCVLHKCDRRECTRIDHLFLGTNDENMIDMVSKNRQMHGSSHYCVKLRESEVVEIKQLLKTNLNQSQISRKFNVSPGAINNIASGRSWKHIKDV